MANYDDLFNVQSEETAESGAELHPFDMNEYKARKQAERDNVYGLIDHTAEEMKSNGEKFQTYLDVQARFDRYSVNNAILIAAQLPEAVGPLKAFDDWKAENVYIKRGEDAVSILEPVKEYTKDDGNTATGFNVKKVFDLSQTKAQRTAPVVTRDGRLLLKSLISHAPCEMKISENMPENMNAVYSAKEKTIYVRQGMDAPDIFRALSSELAHAHMDKEGDYRRAGNLSAAYCVSYILCKRYGVPTDMFHFDNMPEEYKKMETADFRKELAKIRDVAGEISRDMNRTLEEQARSKKDRGEEAR